MTSPKPTFVFVPGAWHTPSIWNKVVALLKVRGYTSLTPSLPSTHGSADVSILDDITIVRSAILSQTSIGHDVIVVVHSAGGIVGASAISGLARPIPKQPEPEPETSAATSSANREDTKSGKKGYVIGFAMIATGFAATGHTMLSASGGVPPPFWTISLEGFAVFTDTTPSLLREIFYHDVPIPEGDALVAALTTQAVSVLRDGGEYVVAGWKEVPCWFLATSEDRAFPVSVQRMLVEKARGDGGRVTLREVRSGHSPMVSREREVVEWLLDAERVFVSGSEGEGEEVC